MAVATLNQALALVGTAGRIQPIMPERKAWERWQKKIAMDQWEKEEQNAWRRKTSGQLTNGMGSTLPYLLQLSLGRLMDWVHEPQIISSDVTVKRLGVIRPQLFQCFQIRHVIQTLVVKHRHLKDKSTPEIILSACQNKDIISQIYGLLMSMLDSIKTIKWTWDSSPKRSSWEWLENVMGGCVKKTDVNKLKKKAFSKLFPNGIWLPISYPIFIHDFLINAGIVVPAGKTLSCLLGVW